MNSICIFGDSTAWGAWDMEKGGWVNRLWLYTGEKTDGECEIYNLSISGGTTETILERFESEAKILTSALGHPNYRKQFFEVFPVQNPFLK